MNQFRFGSKAATLGDLSSRLSIGQLCPQIVVDRKTWSGDAASVVDRIVDTFSDGRLAVRSSARGEDSETESLAGAFTSLLNVAPESDDLHAAVERVFASYSDADDRDEVLVQPMVENVAISGVVLTRDLDTGSPYYVINYDSDSGRTDVVTSGKDSKTVLLHRSRPDMLKSPRMRKLVDSIIEIERVTGSFELDIEFCITEAEEVFILQVRPLAARSNWSKISDGVFDNAIDEIRNRIVSLTKPDPTLAGDRTILSEMTDWNPAEMIGNSPKPLALSLYKTLITDSVWADARARMGYRMVDGPLLYDFHGRPYIDVRKSLNSLLPAGLDPAHAETIVTHQLGILHQNRNLHDKVEFAIAVTCRDFESDKIDRRLADAGLPPAAREDVQARIQALTADIIRRGANGLTQLIDRADGLLNAPAPEPGAASRDAVRHLLETCRTDGTLQFSQLARHGFIGVQLLNSLAARGVFSDADIGAFMHGVQTVATDLIRDMNDVHGGNLSVDSFMQRYGHLRPGTYDIMSWRYEERPDLYIAQGQAREIEEHVPFTPTDAQRRDIQKLIDEAGFETDVDGLLDYIVTAIKGREQSKFAFTRAISNALKIIAQLGDAAGFSREDMSFVGIGDVLGIEDAGRLGELIDAGRESYALTRALRLPHVILDAFDIDVVRMPLGQPTFVTGKSVTAKGHFLTSMEPSAIDDRIVLIESADPGFDWIFSHRVLGLITKYGGANSHMAIRCAEFGLPAAIGCGERLFDNLCKARTIELNAAARRVTSH